MTEDTRPISRRVGIAALIVSGGVLASRLLGQVRDIVFAGMLGASGATDVYVAAFRIPDFLNYLLAGGFLSITFIPIFARYLAADDEEGGWTALTAIIRPIAVAITALVAVGWVITPTVLAWLFPDFSPEQLAEAIRLTRIVLPAQIFFVVGALFTAVQYAKGRFVIPTIAPIAYNLGIIAGGVLQPVITGTDPSPEGFIWGALVGAFVGNFLLQWWGAARAGMRWMPGTGWRHPAIAEYLAIALPLMIGLSVVVLDDTFMSVFGNRVGEATQTHLQYARRTMLVPVGTLAQAAGVAAFPFLARLFAEGKGTEMADAVDRTLRTVLVLSLAATGLTVALTQPVIRTLFERGSFTATDTVATASALFFYALAIPLWGGLQILSRGFYARKEMWTPVVIGTVASLVAVPVYVAMQSRFGRNGVAAASTLVLALYTVALAAAWYRRLADAGRVTAMLAAPARSVPLIAAGSLAAFGVAWVVARGLGDGWWAGVVAVTAGTVSFAAVGLVAGGLLHDRFGRGRLRPG
ncbi:MAG: murein biosynthesis integral membrane protein MurJ [Acidimicrobiia bacterium]|nr:murein biosynthesis integral membrane protein MurJ [Acidimicrobiia bacterium]